RSRRRGVDGEGRAGSRRSRRRPEPVLSPRVDTLVPTPPWCRELPRGVRHHPPTPADGNAAQTPSDALLRPRASAGRGVPRGGGLGAATVVRGQWAPTLPSPARGGRRFGEGYPRPFRMGGQVLVANPGPRASGGAGAGGALRRDPL